MFYKNHDKINNNAFLKDIDFKCQKCSVCCRIYPGAVYLTDKDISKILKFIKIKKLDFFKKYCRPIEKNGIKLLSLKEKSNFDCIFWNNGCIIYPARPTQCSTYPFWPSIISSKERWEEEAKHCKGINKKGNLTFKQKVKFFIKERKAIYVEYPKNL